MLPLDATTIAGGDRETSVQQPGDCLDRVQFAVAVEGEPDDVVSVLLVPRDPRPGVHEGLIRLREDFVEEGAIAREEESLPKVGADVQSNALVGVRAGFNVVGVGEDLRLAGPTTHKGFEGGDGSRRTNGTVLDLVFFELFKLADHG